MYKYISKDLEFPHSGISYGWSYGVANFKITKEDRLTPWIFFNVSKLLSKIPETISELDLLTIQLKEYIETKVLPDSRLSGFRRLNSEPEILLEKDAFYVLQIVDDKLLYFHNEDYISYNCHFDYLELATKLKNLVNKPDYIQAKKDMDILEKEFENINYVYNIESCIAYLEAPLKKFNDKYSPLIKASITCDSNAENQTERMTIKLLIEDENEVLSASYSASRDLAKRNLK